MISLVVGAALLTVVTIGVLLLPLVRKRRSPTETRSRFDMRVYRDQLAEVDRDAARGLLGAEEAEAARVEVKRRMLAAVEADEPRRNAAPNGRGIAELAGAIVLIVPAAAVSLYLALGAPHNPDQPLAQRRSDLATTAVGDEQQLGSLEEVAAQLAKKLESRPDRAEGWFLLGRAYMTLNRFQDAVTALRRACDLAPDQPEVAGAYAEALIAEAGGQVSSAARQALQKVLALDPMSAQARFLLALDRAQQGDLRGAVQGWVDLVAIAPADAGWLTMVHQHLEKAAAQAGIDPASVQPSPEARALIAGTEPGPGADDVAAAREMSTEQRAEMTRGMVDRLATRLRDKPDDLEGWRRLTRAYEVLGEADKARDAQARVDALERR